MSNPKFVKMLPVNQSAIVLPSVALLSLLVIEPAHSAAFSPGNLLVSVNEFTGSITAPTYVAEFTTSGIREQILFDVPAPGTTRVPTTETARDLVVDSSGNIQLYNGTFDPYLLTYDVEKDSFTQRTFVGWSTVNNGSYGGIATLGEKVFLTDMETFGVGDRPQGIISVDTDTFASSRFATEIEPNDLNIGLDGTLYALDGSGSPRSQVYLYDPVLQTQIATVNVLRRDHRAVAGAADGTFFTATWGGEIMQFDQNGSLLNLLTVPFASFNDIDIAPDGQIALGNREGEVILTDTSLTSFSRFDVSRSGSGTTFVTWFPSSEAETVPEPGNIVSSLFVLGLGICLKRTKFF
ncbi:MAG: hypothetical protein AAF215_30090 [Cyanobacteria bacterium P01_A01_bin.123]